MVKNKTDIKITGLRGMIGNLLIILSALYTLYLIIIMLYKTRVIVEKSSYMTVFTFEMVICVFMLIGAFDVRFGFLTAMKHKWLRTVGWGVRALVCLVVAFVLILFVAIVVNSFIRNDEPVKNVIVLGMALEDGKPNKDLINRVDTAYRYAEKNPEATLIVTGGNKGENGKTEADVMRELLVERGLPESRIITEDEAVDTVANFENVAKKIGTMEPVMIVSSSYHLLRACGIAKKKGFEDIRRLPARASLPFWLANVTWEIVCEANSLL